MFDFRAPSDVPRSLSRVGPVERFEVDQADARHLRELAEAFLREPSTPWTESQLLELSLTARRISPELSRRILSFRLSGRPAGGLVISGLALDTEALGPTPLSISDHAPTTEVEIADRTLLLLASALGEPFSYATVQDGNLLVDILPVPGNEDTQLGTSSSTPLAWHIEEAFHDFRSDWLMLFCLRNDEGVPTTFARISDVQLEPDVFEALFEERYTITRYSPRDGDPMTETAKTIPILSGDRADPFLRIDPAFMDREPHDPTAGRAINDVIDGLDDCLQDVVLRAGDLLIIDNLRAVHGRRGFSARYDGSDRWLRISNVAADLRRAEGHRFGPTRRTLSTTAGKRPKLERDSS